MIGKSSHETTRCPGQNRRAWWHRHDLVHRGAESVAMTNSRFSRIHATVEVHQPPFLLYEALHCRSSKKKRKIFGLCFKNTPPSEHKRKKKKAIFFNERVFHNEWLLGTRTDVWKKISSSHHFLFAT